jgi:6-phosphogluconolactonase
MPPSAGDTIVPEVRMSSCKSGFLRVCLCSTVAAVIALTGCGQFFPPLGSSGSGGSGSSGSGDYIYVGNVGTNPLSVAGFTVASSGLSNVSGSPLSVSVEPTALAVNPANTYLFVGSEAGDIYVYTIGSNGALTLGNSGSPVASGVTPSVLRVDPTGKFLVGGSGLTGQAFVFQIGSGGALTSISSSLVSLSSDAVTDLEIAPSGSYVYASCGTGGIFTMSFDTGTGAMAEINNVVNPKTSLAADMGLAIAPSGSFLFAAETVTGGVRVFSIGTSGALTEASGSPYTTNSGAWSVLVDSTGSYVYVANRTAGTISAFLLSNSGALTQISGSPFTTGTLPVAMVEDSTHTYIAVINYGGSSDIQVFSISSTTPGALTSFATAKTGTDPTEASSIAATNAAN